MTDPSLRAQLKAIDIAIKCVTDWRRRHYGPGHWAYESGVRDLTFAEDGHRHYEEYSQALRQLEDLKEILTDPGVTVDEMAGLPLFETMEQS